MIHIASSEPCRHVTAFERIGTMMGRHLAGTPLHGWLRRVYLRLMRLGTARRGLACRLPGGERVRILPEYRYLTWNLEEYHAFRHALRPGGIALDVGANVGGYALLFGQWVGRAGKVYAFEPAPQAFAGLRRHIALNGLDKIVIPIQAAVTARTGIVRLQNNNFQGTNRLLTPAETMHNRRNASSFSVGEKYGTLETCRHTVTVPAVTIDAFCSRAEIMPDLIKVDVEGLEAEVLRGARRTIAAARGRLSLFVEMHPSIWSELGVSKEDLVAELDSQGLTVAALGEGISPWTVEGVCLQLAVSREM